MTDHVTASLTHEINKLKHIAQNPKEHLSVSAFMNAMMRGGFHEIIEHNGGKLLCFGITDPTGDRVTLQEFYIPPAEDGKDSLRGFLLAANDGSDTLDLFDANIDTKLERELLAFFNELYGIIEIILAQGNQIEVFLRSESGLDEVDER